MNDSYKIFDKVLAWSVHIFTASGILAGLLAILAISDKNWRTAMAWLIAALVIDGVDGTLARRFSVNEVLPFINGKTMDYVIDFANYALIPAYFFHSAGLVHPALNLPLTCLILLVSAVYYGKEGMVSGDGNYFIGFPVMWNMVVFYLIFVFSLNEWVNAAVIIILSIMHFVPAKFAYPSRATRLKNLTLFFTVILLVAMPLIVWFYPTVPATLKWIAAVCLAYFGGLAFVDTFQIGRPKK